ncbi:NAD(P)-dependent oxidoreductase [Mucilaginibacter sp.]|uniref:NAD(P)-dependent oxidoreductase n=1 Tax=Mucilaginibacter sp. TaxID=1882438 RepID=UPI003D0C2EBB
MRILILGATGRTGKLVVNEAINQGYQINVLVRNKNNFHINALEVTVYEGLTTNISDVTVAMQGCDAIISALNISRTSDFPWAKLRTSKNFISASLKVIIAIANQQNINRLITVSAWGVAETKAQLPFWFKWMIDHSNIKYGYQEHEKQEQLLKNSALNWTCVRPSILTNSKNKKEVTVSFDNIPKPGLFISRQMVAKFIIDSLKNNWHIKQSPTISEK